MNNFDFCGWATKNNITCSDGRIIRKDAFKHNDGKSVPLVWNHDHKDPDNILGHAVLENREDGVFAYCKFNSTDKAKTAKIFVEHGDITSLSIYANRLKQQGPNVMHGEIREVSLVLAGANSGAVIENIIRHGEESDEEAIIYFYDEELSIQHAEDTENKKEEETVANNEKTVQDVFNEMTEEQQDVVYAMIGMALEENGANDEEVEHSYYDDEYYEGGEDYMKHNVFDQEEMYEDGGVLTHADQEAILEMAKRSNVGTFQTALQLYAEENGTLTHGFDEEDMNALFPDFKDVRPGAPELLTRDQGWVSTVMTGVHKSPISRIRTRQMDARGTDLRALGYDRKQNGGKKVGVGNPKLLQRTTDPQTVYRVDSLHRDDIIDITEFDVVNYQYGIMKQNLNEELALAIMIGDGRDDGDEHKIKQEHIRSIWLDDDLYTIHHDVDIAAAKAELQGTNTSANFGDNYVYAEAIVTAALYSREKYKGSGNLAFFCTPHLLNVMLLARDLNGRRIYDSKTDLAAALNVSAINTVEQFEGKTRTDKEGNTKKLLGIFVNLKDYQVGATKGGEITKFEDFDIDFNQHKYLIETRLSGALTRVFSAIALEEPVTAA